MAKKQRRGFAAMSPEKQRAAAIAGGRVAQMRGAHRWSDEEARRNAAKGGKARAEKARRLREVQERLSTHAAGGGGSPGTLTSDNGAETTPMATEQRRRSSELVVQMVSADLETLQRRGVQRADVTVGPFSGRDSLRAVYDASLIFVLQLRALIEEEQVARASRAQEGIAPGVAGPAAPVDATALLMVHRNVGGRCQFCDEPFPCTIVRGMGR